MRRQMTAVPGRNRRTSTCESAGRHRVAMMCRGVAVGLGFGLCGVGGHRSVQQIPSPVDRMAFT